MKGILFASFGSTCRQAREKQIDAVAQALQHQFPADQVAQAYTSGMVRVTLEGRGIRVPGVPGALEELARCGITDMTVQPGHLLEGEEYEKLCTQAESRRGLFQSLRIGTPLLSDTADLHRLADILRSRHPARRDSCVVLIGHGTKQSSNAVYAAMDYRFKELGRNDIFVGTVEAYPGLDTVMELLSRDLYRQVLLVPLMLVAGDHALHDMAGNAPDSWASSLRSAGYRVQCCMEGLGELAEVQRMVGDHLRQTIAGTS